MLSKMIKKRWKLIHKECWIDKIFSFLTKEKFNKVKESKIEENCEGPFRRKHTYRSENIRYITTLTTQDCETGELKHYYTGLSNCDICGVRIYIPNYILNEVLKC